MKTQKTLVEEFAGLLGVLASDPSPDVAVRSLVQGFLTPFEVQRASLHVLSSDGNILRMVGDYGYPRGSTTRFVNIDRSINLPVTQVLRGTQPVVMKPRELPERFPLLQSNNEHDDVADLGEENCEWVFAPIQLDGSPSAVFVFLAREGVLDEHQNLVALRGLCHALTLWLYRARSTWPFDGILPGLGGATPLSFTPRQRTVLTLVAKGKSNAEIAEDLGCSRSTVKQELQRVMFALAVGSRAQAVARARELSLI